MALELLDKQYQRATAAESEAASFAKSWFGFWRKKKPTSSKSTNNNTASTERDEQ